MFNKIREKLKKRNNVLENPDPTPMALPAHMKRPPTLQEQIRSMVRSERLAQEALANGFETFEDADDFDVGDDYDPRSPHELVFDPELGEISQDVAREVNETRQNFDKAVSERRKSRFKEEKPKARNDASASSAPAKPEPEEQ